MEVLRIPKFSQYLLVIPEGQLVKGKEPKLQEDENADFVGADNADSTKEDWFVFFIKIEKHLAYIFCSQLSIFNL